MLALAVALLVGADRIFLGVHNVSDVVAGYLLGAGMVLAWLAFYDPTPRSIALDNPPLAEAVPNQRKKLAVILNPSKIDEADAVPRAGRGAGHRRRASHRSSGGRPPSRTPATGWRTRPRSAAADLVLAIGGDGTIRAVCEELAGTGIPVGIVPAGTGNLLARNLDIPLYLRSAVDVALNGQDRAIDMVEVSGDKMEDATFLVMAGHGLRRRDHGGRQRGHQGQGRLARLRLVGAEVADVPGDPGRGLRRRRRVHPPPRPHAS